ncbi:hypothetical protein F5I97DRAFT_1928018 [Phlebopus sp. FC_14]|nr:hypothetical protein F5I97DRAFT_1928018 [Phlebopus sp. FC_14]
MSSARGWFAKRAHPPPKDRAHSVSTEKLPLPPDCNKSPASFKFNTLAAVMGKKSKKPLPTLAIQDQSSNSQKPAASDRPNTPRYTNRPPAKSISSTLHSGEDSAEPQTPSDLVKDRTSFPCSVMTLTDPDPFAASAISIPHAIADGNNLSFLSNTDAYTKNDEHFSTVRRTSLVTTLSHSHHAGNPSPQPQQVRSPSTFTARKSFVRTTPGQISPDPNSLSEAHSLSSGWDYIPRPALSKCDSSATLTDKRSTETSMSSRPPTLAKEDTEPGSSRKVTAVSPPPRKSSMSLSSRSPSISYSPSPSLSRDATTSRLASGPPPAPPISCTSSEDAEEEVLSPSGSGSSSSISFASSTSSTRDPDADVYFKSQYRTLKGRPSTADHEFTEMGKSRYHKELANNSLADIFSRSPVSTRPTSSGSQSLKKSVSHSTLQKLKVGQGITSTHSTTVGSPAVDKEIRRQRSFHQSRLQSSPITSFRNAHHNAGPMDSTSPVITEQRRGTAASPPVSVRKRLFSGSSYRRPSTGVSDDDLRSVFSVPTDVERGQGTASLNPPADEGSGWVPSGAVSPAPDYAQRIMSPAEMLKVEAIVQSEFDAKYGEALRNRQRNVSFTSASNPLTTGMTYMTEGQSISSFHRFSPSITHGNSGAPPTLRFSTRPSTAQDSTHSPHSSISPIVGLPPPPRSQSRPHTAETTYSDMSSRRSSSIPFNSLSPPPPRRLSTRVSLSGDKNPHKSMIRKPSFLEITDETPSEAPPYDGSFLDLDSGKESLDLPREEYDVVAH